jgi:zinc transport system substrate-binding protein
MSCGGAGPLEEPATARQTDSTLSVYVVNYPLQYFAERIGGDLTAVEFPAPPDADPAFWLPDADTVGDYQNADLILLNGADYAKWIPKATLPPSKLVDTSVTFKDRFIHAEDGMTHSHGPAGEHSHGETAFTTWLDMTLAVEHAKAIRDAFVKAKPDREAYFQDRFVALERDLLSMDERLQKIVAGKTDKPLLGSHPVYQYLARRYGLDIRSVHFEPDEFPSGDAWHELERIIENHPAKWMLWEGEPSVETRDKLESLGVGSIVFDPCGNKPDRGDLMTVMKNNLVNLEKVFSDS